MFDSRSSSSSNESYFLISITYLAAALYCIGALLLVFYIALSCRLISNLEADNMIVLLQSPSTLYMMLLVTALALVKDKMFVHVNTVTTPVDLKCIPTTRRKPQKPTLWGLSCTLFITLSLITLHSKGALTKLVDAVSSTDFLTTTDIVYSTMESIAKELLQQEIIPSDFRSTIHSAEYNSEGILKNNEYVAFCGNRDNIFHHPRQAKVTPLYIYNQNNELVVYEGRLFFKKLGFPMKYLYVIITALFPMETEPSHQQRQLVWSSTKQSLSTEWRFKFDTGDVLRIEKRLGGNRGAGRSSIPYKLIYSDSRFSVATGCLEPERFFFDAVTG